MVNLYKHRSYFLIQYKVSIVNSNDIFELLLNVFG